MVHLELYHRYPMPPHMLQKAQRGIDQRLVERDAFSKDAHASRRRFLAKTPVCEHGERDAVVHQDENSLSLSYDAALDQ